MLSFILRNHRIVPEILKPKNLKLQKFPKCHSNAHDWLADQGGEYTLRKQDVHKMFLEWWQVVRETISNYHHYEIHNLEVKEVQQQIQQLEILSSQHLPSNAGEGTAAFPHHHCDSWIQPQTTKQQIHDILLVMKCVKNWNLVLEDVREEIW